MCLPRTTRRGPHDDERHVPPVLVTGGTGRGLGAPSSTSSSTRACRSSVLTRRLEAAAMLPANVEVSFHPAILTVPESLDTVLRGVGAVFLVWTALPKQLLRRLSSVSLPTHGGSCFCHHRTKPCTLSSSRSNLDGGAPRGVERLIAAAWLERRSSGRGCSRRTCCSGGRPRFAPTASSGVPIALPRRQHQVMTATWQLPWRGRYIRSDMLEATTSSLAPSP